MENNIAVATAASHGMGRFIAIRFAQEGACVVVADLEA
jgi:NAD(P)-dependent dehydrogenase (short-subunit alcohol dehydrogenase family)